jgi:hypothetical protein
MQQNRVLKQFDPSAVLINEIQVVSARLN